MCASTWMYFQETQLSRFAGRAGADFRAGPEWNPAAALLQLAGRGAEPLAAPAAARSSARRLPERDFRLADLGVAGGMAGTLLAQVVLGGLHVLSSRKSVPSACARTEAGYDLLDPFDVFPIEFAIDGRSGAPIDYRSGNIPHRSGNTKSYRFANDWRARAVFLSVGSRCGGRWITEQTQHHKTYDRDD